MRKYSLLLGDEMNEEAFEAFKIILIIMQLMAFCFGAIFGISWEKRKHQSDVENDEEV